MVYRRLLSTAKPVVVPTLIVINIVVFLMWRVSQESEIELRFMMQNFLVSWTTLNQGRFWCLLTSAFSHNMLWHLFINMYVLNSFGPILERTLGAFHFLNFYLIAAIVSSLGHAFVSSLILNQPEIPALGASGAISGIVLLFSMMFPREKILLFGLIPMPAMWGAVLFVGLDIWGVVAQAEGGGLPIGHGAHLGGALTGLVFYLLFQSREMRQQRNE